MLEFFTPLELLNYVESQGYKLKVKGGRLVGPPGLQPEIVEQVQRWKVSLITLLTYQCPNCNQPIRDAMNTENVLYIECSHDPTHFSHVMPRKRGLPSFITTGGIKPANCVGCDKPNDGDWKYCSACWLALFEEDQANASESEQV